MGLHHIPRKVTRNRPSGYFGRCREAFRNLAVRVQSLRAGLHGIPGAVAGSRACTAWRCA